MRDFEYRYTLSLKKKGKNLNKLKYEPKPILFNYVSGEMLMEDRVYI